MSNMFGSNQNNPQLAGANIVGVNPGNAMQRDAQALQRAQGVPTAGMTANAGALGGLTAGATGFGGMSAGAGLGGMTSSAGLGGMSAGVGGMGGLAANAMSSSVAGNQNNPQLAGANIIGVNPGNAQIQDAQSLQRAQQAGYGAQQ